MPVGLALGGAAIGAVATIGSGAMAADAQRDAARTASDSSYAVAQMNNDLFRETRAENLGVLGPYASGGLPAMYMMNDLLGISSYPVPASALAGYQTNPTPQAQTPVATPTAGTGAGALAAMRAGTYTGTNDLAMPTSGPQANMVSLGGVQGAPLAGAVGTTARPRLTDYGGDAAGWRAAMDAYRANRTAGTTATPGTAAPGAAGGGALDAFDRFRQGTNYQWRLNEGANILNSKAAALGHFESGAADKALLKYGQNFASNELSNYMNLLAGQQAMGLSAAGAVAGVNTSYAGNVAAQNMNAGNSAANAALIGGQATANMWGGVGQGIGQIGGALSQWGMGQAGYLPGQYPQYGYGVPGSSGPIVNSPGYSPGAQAVNWTGF